MKKNVFKKLAALVATTAMAVCAIVATPTEAKADTTKTLYLVTDEASTDEYILQHWGGSNLVFTGNAVSDASGLGSWDPTPVSFVKVEDGLYKLDVTVKDAFDETDAAQGIDIYVNNSTSKFELKGQWTDNNTIIANWTAIFAALKDSSKTEIYVALDADNSTYALTTAPSSNPAPVPTPTPENPDTGDMAPVVALVAVAALAAVVAMRKRTVND